MRWASEPKRGKDDAELTHEDIMTKETASISSGPANKRLHMGVLMVLSSSDEGLTLLFYMLYQGFTS